MLLQALRRVLTCVPSQTSRCSSSVLPSVTANTSDGPPFWADLGSLQRRWMGTKMLERSPGELHTYNINKEGSKFLKRFKGLQPSSAEAAESLSSLLSYFIELIDDNPFTVTSRNGAVMLTRIGRAETIAHMGEWWFEKPQQLILQKISALFYKQLFRCTLEEMTNALWGISFLGPKVMALPLKEDGNMDVLVHDLVNRLLRDSSKLRAVDLTVLVEGLARLQYRNIDFVMKAVTYETKMKLMRFHDNDIPRYLWSLAQLGYPGRDGTDKDGLLSALAWECKRRADKWNGMDTARVVWAFGVLKFNSVQHLLTIISSQYLERVYLKGDGAVKLLWGFDALNHHPGNVSMTKLGRAFAMDVNGLFPRDIVTGCLSLLNLGLVDDRVPTRMKELVLKSEVEHWSAREAANMIWFLARADFLEQDMFMVLRRFILQCKPDELPANCQADLYRCFLHLNVFRPSMARLFPARIGEACQNAWIEFQRDLPPSPVLPEVMERLTSMGYSTEVDCAIQEGLLFAHVASKDVDSQLAVEIIHPPKCFINVASAVTNQQSWREDLLNSWGWKILRVDEKRWGRIQSEKDKMDYLSMLINRA